MCLPHVANELRRRFSAPPRKQCDGPTARLVLMPQHAALGPLVAQLMNHKIDEGLVAPDTQRMAFAFVAAGQCGAAATLHWR